MVNEILRDVQKLERNIDYNTKSNDTVIDVPWITTYGPGSLNVKKYSKIVNNAINDFAIFENRNRVVQPVFRKNSSLTNLLFSQKKLTTARSLTSGNPTVKCTDPTVVRRGRK